MQEEESGGISLGEIFRVIWKRKWYIAAATVLVTLVATLVFAFLVNPLCASYELSFDIVYPASDTLKFPDGTPFYYQNIVSADYLERAHGSDEAFSGIDVKKLLEKNDIQVEAETEEIAGVREYTGKYTIEAKASYFSDKALANGFLQTLARIPERIVKEAADDVDFTTDETLFSEASFESRIALLTEAKKLIVGQFDDWIELLGGSYRVGGGRNLMAYRGEIAVVFDEKTQSSLERELEQGGYVPAAQVAAERLALKTEYEINEKKIEALTAAAKVSTVSFASLADIKTKEEESDGPQIVFPEEMPNVSQTLAALIARNENIRYQLGDELDAANVTKGALTEANVIAFAEKLQAQFNALNGAANTARTVSAALYEKEAYTRFDTTLAELKGEVSLVLVAVLAFVLSLFLACAVANVAESSSKRKAEAKNAAGTSKEKETPQGAEAQTEETPKEE